MRIELKKPEVYDDSHRSLESYTEKEKWSMLTPAAKRRYIWDYYRFPILGGIIALLILSYVLFTFLTHKETVLTVGIVNLSGRMDPAVTSLFDKDFIEASSFNPRKQEVSLLTELYVSDDEAFSTSQIGVVSQIKLSTYIGSQQLDVVLMDQVALEHFITDEYILVDSVVDVSNSKVIQKAGLTGPVYLGVIVNTERLDAVNQYIDYLTK